MTESAELRLTLLRDILSAAEADYARALDSWKGLETKAQGSVAVAGVFIGGSFAIAKDLQSTSSTGLKLLAGGVVATLVVAVVYAVRSLRVRLVTSAPTSENLDALVTDLLQVTDGEDLTAREPGYVRDRIRLWQQGIADHEAVNEDKARLIATAHRLLLVAVIGAAILVVATLVNLPSFPRINPTASSGGVYEMREVRLQPGCDFWQQLLRSASATAAEAEERPTRDGQSGKP